ncbi:MAG TPA: hypothetical protein VGA60_04215 [Kiloniellales bacterium]
MAGVFFALLPFGGTLLSRSRLGRGWGGVFSIRRTVSKNFGSADGSGGFAMSTIIFSPKDKRHRLGTELSMLEFAAIGYVTVSWSQLEHLLLQSTAELADKANVPIPTDATAASFKKRIRALRKLAKEVITGPKTRQKFLNLLNKISGIEQSRHRITHGLWDWLPTDPDKLHASSFRPPYEFEEPFDHHKLVNLAKRIGELNFQLAYPKGEKQAMDDYARSAMQRGGHVSRLGMQLLTGKDISSHHPHLASLLKHKEPPPS